MKKIDMHVHTNASDGVLTPIQVINWAIEANLGGVAITDHDTIDGYIKARNYIKDKDDFLLIPGIEFSCIYKNSEVHILGYLFDCNDKNLNDICDTIKRVRSNRAKEILKKLEEQGILIDESDLNKVGSINSIGRPHIARIMVAKGYAKDIDEAFNKWIGRNQIAYVERYKITIEEAIKYIKDAGGVSVLAHPGLLKPHVSVSEILDKGLDGIEAYHSKHSYEQSERFHKIAKVRNIYVTSGTDFHEPDKDGEIYIGKIHINNDEIEKMLRNPRI